MPAPLTVWFDWEAGRGVADDGRAMVTKPRPPVGVLLEAVPHGGAALVNLTGGRPGDGADGFHAWRDATLPRGWSAGGHFLRRLTMPILRYDGPAGAGGRRVELQRAAAWFGEGDYSPDECAAAFGLVRELVEQRFGADVMRVRPAATGQECFLRVVPADGLELVDEETAELIRSTSGQGRIETLASSCAAAAELELGPHACAMRELVEYDGRFMYAALCRELPTGRVVRGAGDGGFDAYARGRYLVEWQVPADWSHLGLLPMMETDAVTWCYPRRPLERGRGWVDAVELYLARKHGWRVRVLEHMVWPDRGRPLDKWSRLLIEARDAVRLRAMANGCDDRVAELARSALRAVTLFGLGAFVGRPYAVTHRVPLGTKLPAGALEVVVEGDRITYQTYAARNGPALEHPEWPATVWARCRVRMLEGPRGTGALRVPFSRVVGIHTDALYLSRDPHWPDDGDAGRLRHKNTWPGPHRWPADETELLRLLRELRKKDRDAAL